MSELQADIQLFICPTPIGNLSDITLRTINTLKNVDLIACEDTRVSGKLLKHYQIKKELISYHEHNKHQAGQMLIDKMKSGQTVALISDAGMPGINDPGSELILRCQEEEISYSVLPGPSAFTTALVYSGMDSSSFAFRGFFPKSNKDKNRMEKTLAREELTTIFYETPHRITKTLDWIAELWPEREIAVIREISKIYEEMIKGTAINVVEKTADRQLKGELVLIIAGIKEQVALEYDQESLEELFTMYTEQGLTKKEAVAKMAFSTGIRKNVLNQKFAR